MTIRLMRIQSKKNLLIGVPKHNYLSNLRGFCKLEGLNFIADLSALGEY